MGGSSERDGGAGAGHSQRIIWTWQHLPFLPSTRLLVKNEQEMVEVNWSDLDPFLPTLMGHVLSVCNLGREQLTNGLVGDKTKQ